MTSRHRSFENASSGPDVVYIGHFEPDGRAEVLEAIAATGLEVELYGTRWDEAPASCAWIRTQTVEPLTGEAYARKLSDARIGLVFLSAHNSDVWTRRCFEIPACGTLMLAPRSAPLEAIFRDGIEAVYYDDAASAAQLAVRYSDDGSSREAIASAGRSLCVAEHSEVQRAEQILQAFRRHVGGGEGG